MRRQAVVLAGGLATRMLPRTERVPKYMLEVAGVPFAHLQLARLRESGFDEVVLCVGHLGDVIRAALGDGAAFGLALRYVDEGEARLGTGGALSLAARVGALAESFVVVYGDSYLTFDHAGPLVQLEASPELEGVMAVWANANELEPSNVALSADGRVARYDKKAAGGAGLSAIDYGATALRRRVVEGRAGAHGLDEVQASLSAAGKLGAHVVATRFFEIGSAAGLEALEAWLAGATRPTAPSGHLPAKR